MSAGGDGIDDGWDDAPEGGGGGGGEEASGLGPQASGSGSEGAPAGGERRRRRRRRRGGGGGEQQAQSGGSQERGGGAPMPDRARLPQQQDGGRGPQQDRPPQPQRQSQPQRQRQQDRQRAQQQDRQRPEQGPQRDARQPQERPRRDDRGNQRRDDRPHHGRDRRDERTERRADHRDKEPVRVPNSPEPVRFERAPSHSQELDAIEDEEPKFVPEPDDGSPAPTIDLKPDLARVPDDDPDPLTADTPTDDDQAEALQHTIVQVVGVRFVPAGKLVLHDSGELRYERGDRVVVDTDRGPRLATIATATERRPAPGSPLRRVLRRAHAGDLRAEAELEATGKAALLVAKEKARVLDLPIKVFRVEPQPGKRLLVYFTSEDRIDLRDFLREVGAATGTRVELRQIGARDEAKLIGGIGSCGQELCCATWLPEMVPVSIKMAKDQGLVLNPTKVSGQCGRLKCCLVYEQATYAELRKGLPKLGKRVITEMGEGRVVEVDVLRRRVRVTTGPGEFHVLEADQVRPMFPSGNAPRAEDSDHGDDDSSDDNPPAS